MDKILTEDPYAPLDYDPLMVTPGQLVSKMTAVTNSLVALSQKWEANRTGIINVDKKDAAYKQLNIERYQIETRMEALERKWNTINQHLYTKGNEMRLALK